MQYLSQTSHFWFLSSHSKGQKKKVCESLWNNQTVCRIQGGSRGSVEPYTPKTTTHKNIDFRRVNDGGGGGRGREGWVAGEFLSGTIFPTPSLFQTFSKTLIGITPCRIFSSLFALHELCSPPRQLFFWRSVPKVNKNPGNSNQITRS